MDAGRRLGSGTAALVFASARKPRRRVPQRGHVIYSPAVPVFRDENAALLEAPYRLSFLTAAAPNRGAIASNQPQFVDSVPDEAFDSSLATETRQDWRRYFEWLGESGLF